MVSKTGVYRRTLLIRRENRERERERRMESRGKEENRVRAWKSFLKRWLDHWRTCSTHTVSQHHTLSYQSFPVSRANTLAQPESCTCSLSLSLFLASTNRFSLYFQVKIVIAVSARVQFDVFDGIETHGFERHVSFNRKRFLPPLFSLFRTVRKLFTDSLIFIVKYTVRYEYGISRISFSSVKVLVASR